MEYRNQEEAEVAGDYMETLAGLTENSRPHIGNLTELARDNRRNGEIIVKVIKQRLMKVRPTDFDMYFLNFRANFCQNAGLHMRIIVKLMSFTKDFIVFQVHMDFISINCKILTKLKY